MAERERKRERETERERGIERNNMFGGGKEAEIVFLLAAHPEKIPLW